MISDYGVKVMVRATQITNESSDIDPADFEGDAFEIAMRRDMVRQEMMKDPRYDRRIEDVLKAMEVVGMEIMLAARFFAALNMIGDQKKDR